MSGDHNAAEGSAPSPPVAAGRPKLNLAPRSANAGAAPAGGSSGKPNPFGGAVPREAVIAGRTGVSESEVLKKEASAAVRLRLSSEQQEQKKAKEMEVRVFARPSPPGLLPPGDSDRVLACCVFSVQVAEAKKALAEAKELGDEVISRTAADKAEEAEAALAELMQSFEALAVQLAHEGGKRPSEMPRREDNNAAYGGGQGQRNGPHGGAYQDGGRSGGGGYNRGADEGLAFKNFGGGNRRGPGGDGGAADYGGAFGGRRGGQGGDGYGGGGGGGYQERD